MNLLKGKVAMVTGGTRGIGYAVVKKFLENGAAVALCGSRKDTVDKALEKLAQEMPGSQVIGLWPDLQNPEEVAAAMEQVVEKFGKLDVLVNNAGISARDKFWSTNRRIFRRS